MTLWWSNTNCNQVGNYMQAAYALMLSRLENPFWRFYTARQDWKQRGSKQVYSHL